MKHRQKTRQEMQDDARVDEASVRRPQGFARPDELKWTTLGGDKPMIQEEKKGVSSFAYLMGGFALGAVCGLLLAPKKGSELIEDLTDWGRDTKERGQELYSRAKEYIPHRVKQGVGAAREAGEQA